MDKNQSSSSDGTAVSTSKVKEGSSHTDPSPPQKPLAELSVSSIPSDPKPLAEQDKSSTSLKGQTKGSEEGKVIIESSKSTPTTLSDSGEMTPEKSKKIEISKASESSKSKDRRDSSDSGEEQSGTSRLKGKGQEMKGKAKKRFVAKKTESKKPVTEEKKEKVETVLELDLEFPEEARIPLTIKHPNIIEYTMFANFDSFMCACYKGELRLHHLLPMDKMFSAKTCYDQLVAASDFAEPVTTVCLESAALKPDALWKELLFAFHRFIIHILLIQIGLVITFTAPIYIVRNLILSVMRPPPTPAAYYWCIGLFVSSLCYSILVNHLHYRMFCGGLQQRAALLTALYRKCLTVNTNARRRFTTGDILNFASVDILQLFQFTQVCGNMVGIPTRMLIGFCITFNLLGPAVIGMFCALLVLMPLSIYIVIKLDCVNIIKLFGWEIAFSKKIDVFRDSESHILKKFIMLELVGNVVWNSSPFLIVIATFGVLMFWDAKYQLTADVTFAILMLVGTLRAYLTQLPTVISRFVQARVALKRIESFLHCDDMLENVDHLLEDDGLMIDIRNASFSWGKSIVLKNINLQIKRGELVAVLGPVGSGKSSLMSAILDEMNVHSGKIAVRDAKIAYVPQEAWLQEGSIRQNILFQYGLDKRRYSKVITKCCLEPDLKMFKLGDSSEVGERGMLLSGGQKQRVSIARAVYSQAELNLFDDPLSALDSAVAEKVFRGVISNSGMLKGTTRLLATHNTALLPYCDRIIVLEAGAIMHIGSFEDLKTKLDLRKVCRTETTELTDIQSTRVLSFLQIAASDAKATNTSNDKRLRAEDAANATGIVGNNNSCVL
ncbi:multidrug resistance-associated protein 1-like [Tropilaelaps mercedesae]|uniref:Multidrug resistance-associated protein 1-like n=1 Tax=Tropilaelaps mercedesae TaxID=418985 RepID=A0A1V9X8Y2_9ACAR|nr:multidrug resistance-associated protein 1-like [Tropilaelaps mercedesae]